MITSQDILQTAIPRAQEKPMRAPLITRFTSKSRKYAYKHLFLWFLLLTELLLLALSASLFSGAIPLALIIAALFSTAFSLFMMRMHWTAEKPEIWTLLVEDFAEEFYCSHGYDGSEPKEQLLLSNAFIKVSGLLEGFEAQFFRLPKILQYFDPYLRKCSAYWHYTDVLKMRETLLLASAQELVDLIKLEPLNLDLHASLANSYVLLASLYQGALKPPEESQFLGYIAEDEQELYSSNYEMYSKRAIEEFKILSSYMPNDPWIHKQLALSYNDMKKPLDERREYEILRELNPDDTDTLFKLGRIYFTEGLHAQGLEVYQELLGIDYTRAESLLEYYGTQSRTQFATQTRI